MLVYGKFESILQEGGDEVSFISVGAVGSTPLWDKSLAVLCMVSHTCVWCLGAALAATPQGASELYKAVMTLFLTETSKL